MKFTPRPIASLWRNLWSVWALDAMEPVLGKVINNQNSGFCLINLRGHRSYDHLRANLSTKGVEDVVPVVLL